MQYREERPGLIKGSPQELWTAAKKQPAGYGLL